MAISDEFAFAAARVPIAAAIASFKLAGRGDEKAADQAAVDAMRTALNAMPMKGRIVIGEGERDEAPMLYIGEEVGNGSGEAIDIALDPLEGTTLTAKAMANALAVIAFSPRGGMLHAPDTYMDKIAVGPGYPSDVVDLDAPADVNAKALAKAKGVKVEDIGVCVLDRPRHAEIISALRKVGCSGLSDHRWRRRRRHQLHQAGNRHRHVCWPRRRPRGRAGGGGAEMRRRPIPGPLGLPQ